MGGSISVPYGLPSTNPFWGPPTSHMNFCEEDYVLTHYVAELVNTVTNLAYIGYGIHGIRRFKRQDRSPFATNLPYFGLIGIGVCSAVYHSTLKYHTQMADEMSMHVAMGCILIQLFTFERTPAIQRRNATIIVIGLTSFIIYHCITDEFALHVILTITLSFTAAGQTRKLVRNGSRDQVDKDRLGGMVSFATWTALFAYALWNVDMHLCPAVTRVKRQLGLPWGVLLELHGWWHILTSISAYTFMALVEFLTAPDHDTSHGIGFAWPLRAILQGMAPIKAVDANGVLSDVKGSMNGHATGNGVKRSE